jgi:Tht1-like nuclear fusion protein
MEGIRLIESMKTASSCKTKATQQLLTSCSSLDGNQEGEGRTAEELEKVKSQYAARLAVCELQEASNPPKLPLCSMLSSSGPAETVNRNKLAACLGELQKNMVFWVSYVNNLQNVGYMCFVARAEIEQEQLVEQRRASLQTTLLVTRVLSEFQQSIAAQNEELMSYAYELNELHRQHSEELILAREETSATLSRLGKDLGAQLTQVVGRAEALIELVTANASSTNKEVVQYAENVQHRLANIWQMMLEGNAEIAANQLEASTESHTLVMATRGALEGLIMNEVGGLADALSGLLNQVTSVHEEHTSLAESLDESMAKSAKVADTLAKLNMPVLEVVAKAAGVINFIFSDDFLVLLGFASPMAVVLLCAAFFRVRLFFWLLRVGILLTSSYGQSWCCFLAAGVHSNLILL